MVVAALADAQIRQECPGKTASIWENSPLFEGKKRENVMIVKGIDAKTGKEVEIEIRDPEPGFVDRMRNVDMSDDAVRRMIDKLDISADYKSLLYSLAKSTIQIGEYLVGIGRKILDLIGQVKNEYPNATFGLIFGGIVGFLISSIPFLGQVLGPIVTPLLMAFGFVAGIHQDFQNKALERKIAAIAAEFLPLARNQAP